MKACLDNVFCEIVNPDARGIGDLVVTTLTNELMPLVRYQIGDWVERREQPYSTDYLVHGRARDGLLRRDGQRVTTFELDRCFADADGILHYHLRQDENGAVRLQFISDPERLTPETPDQISSRLADVLQLKNAIAVEPVKMLPPLPSGKLRLTSRAEN